MPSCATFFMSCISWQGRPIPSQNFITTQHFNSGKTALNNNQYCVCAIPCYKPCKFKTAVDPVVVIRSPVEHFYRLKLQLSLIISLGRSKIRLIGMIGKPRICWGSRRHFIFLTWLGFWGQRQKKEVVCVLWVQWWMYNNMSLLCLGYSNMIIT